MSTSQAVGRSLRRDEAEQRARQVSVSSYDVRLDLDSCEETFRSLTTIRFRSHGGGTWVDVKPVRLSSATLDGTPLPTDLLVTGRLPLDLSTGDHELVVDAVMPYRNDGEGLHRSVDPADGRHYVYGMCFLDAAPTVFACFDQPDLKAPYTFRVRAPRDWVVVGNAPAERLGDDAGVAGSANEWQIGPTQPLSTYFVTVVAGPYHVLRSEHDGIPLGLSCRASLAEHLDRDAEELFTITARCFDEYHRLFGIRYPFGDYHQAFVPEFNADAMENPGCVTFRDSLVFSSRVTRGLRTYRAMTVAHEMAHQWFGNITTPRWWDDLWLNESFAEYLGIRVVADVTQYDDAWVFQSYSRRQWGLVADQRPSTHPVAGNGADDAASALQDFDGISYAKGSSILKQLATTLGDEVFFGGVVDHLTRHRFGNATLHDLVASWEHAGADDLSAFTGDWLRTAGPDTILLDRDAGVLRRTPPPDHPADRPHMFCAAVADGDGGWERRPVAISGPETPFAAGDAAVVLDPDDQTWAVFHPDPVTLQALPRLLPGVEDPAVRAGAWNNLRSGYQNAAVDPADVVTVVEASFPVEDTEDRGGHTVPWFLSSVLPVAPAGSLERFHRAATRALAEQPEGSEAQLAAFRAAVSSATSADRLESWLAGPELPAGIEIDLDLRWRLLVRLATIGGIGRDGLDAALAEERTAVSQVEHTRAVASMPTAAAKKFAWQRFTGEVDVANYELKAAGLGMWRPGQEEATAPYVARYFEDLPGTAEVRSGWVLADAAGFFFPATSLEPATLARTEELAHDAGLDAGIRRRLVDRGDQLRRLLAIKDRYVEASRQ